MTNSELLQNAISYFMMAEQDATDGIEYYGKSAVWAALKNYKRGVEVLVCVYDIDKNEAEQWRWLAAQAISENMETDYVGDIDKAYGPGGNGELDLLGLTFKLGLDN